MISQINNKADRKATKQKAKVNKKFKEFTNRRAKEIRDASVEPGRKATTKNSDIFYCSKQELSTTLVSFNFSRNLHVK